MERAMTRKEVWDMVRRLGTSPKPGLPRPAVGRPGCKLKGDIVHAAEMYKAGKSCKEIGEYYDTGERAVRKWLRAADVEMRVKGEKIRGKEDELVRRYQHGDSAYLLAKEYGVARRTITRALKKAGVYAS